MNRGGLLSRILNFLQIEQWLCWRRGNPWRRVFSPILSYFHNKSVLTIRSDSQDPKTMSGFRHNFQHANYVIVL